MRTCNGPRASKCMRENVPPRTFVHTIRSPKCVDSSKSRTHGTSQWREALENARNTSRLGKQTRCQRLRAKGHGTMRHMSSMSTTHQHETTHHPHTHPRRHHGKCCGGYFFMPPTRLNMKNMIVLWHVWTGIVGGLLPSRLNRRD